MKYDKKLTLKQHRILAGYSQEAFAEAIGMDRSTLAVWEGGRLPKAFKTIAKIEELCDISIADDFLMP